MVRRSLQKLISPSRRMQRITVAISCICLLPLIAINTNTQEQVPAKRNPLAQQNAQRGMVQFRQTCAMCHGSEARGSTGPNLIESSIVRHDDAGNLIGDVIRNGRVEKGMPPFSNLTEAEIIDLVAFLHAAVEASDNRASASGPARGLSANRLLVGNVEAGKQFFNGEGKCAGCHSPSKDLEGVAKKYSALELEGRLLYPSLKYETAVVTLPSGDHVKGRILHLDEFYVSLLDEGGNYRSFGLDHGVKVAVDDPLHAHAALLERYKDKDIHDVFAYLETLQ
jgi:cytochrome c oxidase cbb3-type subunit 3